MIGQSALWRRQVWWSALFLLAGMVVAGCGGSPRTLVGYQLTPAPQVGDLELPEVTANGDMTALRAEPGELLLTFFGFTNCPDFCPTTLTTLTRVVEELGDEGSRVNIAFVTVDPDRDTAARLVDYVGFYSGEVRAFRTEDDPLLRRVADRFGVSYEVVDRGRDDAEVGHTTHTFVVDDTGTVVLVWTYGVSAQDIRDDVRDLLDE